MLQTRAGEELASSHVTVRVVGEDVCGRDTEVPLGQLGLVFSREKPITFNAPPFFRLEVVTLNAALFVVWDHGGISFTPFWCQAFPGG